MALYTVESLQLSASMCNGCNVWLKSPLHMDLNSWKVHYEPLAFAGHIRKYVCLLNCSSSPFVACMCLGPLRLLGSCKYLLAKLSAFSNFGRSSDSNTTMALFLLWSCRCGTYV